MNAWSFPISAPGEAHSRRYAELIPFLEAYYGEKQLRILEIGVYKAGLLSALADNSKLRIASYVGVDPYAGEQGDPYLGAYWGSKSMAEEKFQAAKRIFTSKGGKLCRMTSREFIAANRYNEEFDLIYVDGDHSYTQAFWDINAFFPMVASGGLLGIDDYANVDTPDVTIATNKFINTHHGYIAKIAGVKSWFVNVGKSLPVVQVSVFVQPDWSQPGGRNALRMAALQETDESKAMLVHKGGKWRAVLDRCLFKKG
jgi:hypothetical protein